jgi:hypothetical protein
MAVLPSAAPQFSIRSAALSLALSMRRTSNDEIFLRPSVTDHDGVG